MKTKSYVHSLDRFYIYHLDRSAKNKEIKGKAFGKA